MPRSNQNQTYSGLRVGIFVLAGLVVTGFLILNSSGSFNPFEKKMQLRARFVSADGLHSGADVQLAGVSIGKVDTVRFLTPDPDNPDRIEATVSIVQLLDGKPISELIRTDSTVQLSSTSVLGNDKLINIKPGSANGTPVTDGVLLPSSAGVGLNQLTETGNELLGQINKLAVPANEILNKANRGEGTLGRIVNDDALYESLDGAVAETRTTMLRLQTTIDRLNRGQGSAGKLLNDDALYDNLNRTAAKLDAISTDIRAGRGTAGKLVTNDDLYNETRSAVADLRVSAEKISSIADDVKAITTDLNQGKGTAGKLLKDEKFYDEAREAIARFNATTARVESILTDAQAGKGTVGRLLVDDTLYNSVNLTAYNIATFTGEGTKLLDDFRKNPKKYLSIKFSIF
ncbi:MAG: MlaD family protein [Pyrinomonadaceae bacterium]